MKLSQVLLTLDAIERYYQWQIQRYRYANPALASAYERQRDDWRRRFLAAFYPE